MNPNLIWVAMACMGRLQCIGIPVQSVGSKRRAGGTQDGEKGSFANIFVQKMDWRFSSFASPQDMLEVREACSQRRCWHYIADVSRRVECGRRPGDQARAGEDRTRPGRRWQASARVPEVHRF